MTARRTAAPNPSTPTVLPGKTFGIRRTEILDNNSGTIPGSLRLVAYSQHEDDGETLDSFNKYTIDIPAVTSAYSTLTNGGALAKDVVSNVFTVATAGIHNFTLDNLAIYGSLGAVIEYRINGGAWVTAIGATATTGSTTSLAINDTVEIRHRATTIARSPRCVEMDDGTNPVFYATLHP